MTQEKMEAEIKRMRIENPDLKSISIEFGGSGDCFDDFYSLNVDAGKLTVPEVDFVNTYNDLLWAALEKSDANFNDEGSNGTVTIAFDGNVGSIEVSVEHRYIEYRAGDGYYGEFNCDAGLDNILNL